MIFNVSGGAVKVFYIVGRIGNSGYGMFCVVALL